MSKSKNPYEESGNDENDEGPIPAGTVTLSVGGNDLTLKVNPASNESIESTELNATGANSGDTESINLPAPTPFGTNGEKYVLALDSLGLSDDTYDFSAEVVFLESHIRGADALGISIQGEGE